MTADDKPAPRAPSGKPPVGPSWDDEESSTRDTDATIALSSVPPGKQRSRAVLTVISGPSAGRAHAIEGEVILGRGREAHMRIDDGGASRAHARVTQTEAGGYVIEDLGSLNGTFVDGRRIERTELRSGDRIHIGPTLAVTFAIVDEQAERIGHQLYESAMRDPLTRAHNRRFLVERLASEVAYARRHGTPLGIVIFDLDHFKRVNDTYGHLAGDDVLREVSALVQRLIRAEDLFARFGGEEFVVLVRGIEHDNVGRFAERIREAVEALEIASTVVMRVTVSLGYASLSELPAIEGEIPAGGDALLRLADERLYRSKDAGRNRVTGA